MKIICSSCDWEGTTEELLAAANPFEQGSMIHGCPKCKSVDDFKEACDRDGCWTEASIGTPTEDGYKRLCSEHGMPYIRATARR